MASKYNIGIDFAIAGLAGLAKASSATSALRRELDALGKQSGSLKYEAGIRKSDVQLSQAALGQKIKQVHGKVNAVDVKKYTTRADKAQQKLDRYKEKNAQWLVNKEQQQKVKEYQDEIVFNRAYARAKQNQKNKLTKQYKSLTDKYYQTRTGEMRATLSDKIALGQIKSVRDTRKESLATEKQMTMELVYQVGQLAIAARLTGAFFQNISNALGAVRELRLAEIFSGRKFGDKPYTQTAFGLGIEGAGQIYQAAQKSPYASEFLQPENIKQFAFFKEVLGQNVEQLAPFITALRAVDEQGMTTKEVMLMLANAMMKSSFEVGSFTPILAQFIPQMKQAGVSTKEMIGLMGALSNLGTGGRALGMAMPALGLHLVNPSATGKKWYQQFGIVATKEIEKGGLVGLIEKIKSSYDTIVKTQGKDRGLQFLKDISPGREHGALLNIMDKLDYVKKMTADISDTTSAQKAMNAVSKQNGVLMQEIKAQAGNIGKEFWGIVGGSDAFKGVLVVVKGLLGTILEIMKAIGESKVLKNAVSIGTFAIGAGLLKAWVMPILGKVIPLAMGALKASSAGGTLSGLGGGFLGAGFSKLAAIIAPFSGIIAPIVAIAGTLLAIKLILNKKSDTKANERKSMMEDYESLLIKRNKQKGYLSNSEADRLKQVQSDLTNETNRGSKGIRPSEIKIMITDSGNVRESDKKSVTKVLQDALNGIR